MALFKGNMKPEEKAAHLHSFKVWQSSTEYDCQMLGILQVISMPSTPRATC